ncbi:MAG: ATP synthase F1 subunit delta [Bdellovibrio sp.]
MISELSKRYASALFQLGQEMGNLESLQAELVELSKSFENEPESFAFFSSHLVDSSLKNQVLQKALGTRLSAECINLLFLLSEKSRWPLFHEIVEAFSLLQDQAKQIIRGVVRSAAGLSPEQKKALEERVQKTLGQQVVFSFVEDRSVLGGMIAQVGGWTFDDSIQAHLSRINDNLRKHGEEPWRH